MVEDASDKSIQAAANIIGRLLRAQARHREFFLGRLPNWVPEPVAQRFANIAAEWLKIIGARGLKLTVREFPRLGDKGCRFVHPGKIEKVEDLDRFLDDIGFLAHVRYVISLGEHEGLRLLAGEDAARGRTVVQGAALGGRERAFPNAEKQRWWDRFQELRARNPRITVNNAANRIANEIRQSRRLDVSETLLGCGSFADRGQHGHATIGDT